jgi:hypothetical protein
MIFQFRANHPSTMGTLGLPRCWKSFKTFEYSLHSNLALHSKAVLPPSSEPCLLRLHHKLAMGPNGTLASVKSSNYKVATNESLRLPLLSNTVFPLSLKSSSRSGKNLHLHRRATKTFPTLTSHRSLSCNHPNNGNQSSSLVFDPRTPCSGPHLLHLPYQNKGDRIVKRSQRRRGKHCTPRTANEKSP